MYRSEYPRPSLVRAHWQNLNGLWDFAFDDKNVGLTEKWLEKGKFPLKINVPFAFQTPLSGINDQSFHDYVWYRRTFKVEKQKGKRYLLHFGAVDYECKVYLNKKLIGEHIGGQAPFSFDVTAFLNFVEEELVVWVSDLSTDEHMPRGKQYWKEKPEGIWYNRTTGIWQTVWLEIVPEAYVTRMKITPLYDEGKVHFALTLSEAGQKLVLQGADNLLKYSATVNTLEHEFTLQVFKDKKDYDTKSWSPENPYLFKFTLSYGDDHLSSYFGMRKVHAADAITYLNNKPYYMKLVLDQGYWPESLVTPPSHEALEYDIKMAKAMGFNGARKHQKCEDPYFHYYADKLGFLVWAEMASSIKFSELSAWRDKNEWQQIMKRDYNHPSIVSWVPLNESWGVNEIATDKRQQQHALDLYNFIKSQDKTRFVVGNDGWEQVITDICAIHNYNHGHHDDKEAIAAFNKSISTKDALLNSQPAKRPIYANGYAYRGEPILLTEFGGISYQMSEDKGWGYTAVSDADRLLSEYKRIILAIKKSTALVGYCYTQLTDVEQEINGLLTYDRRPKLPVEKVKEVNDLIQKYK
ncbi:MAG: Evolved beta-galactosidase subunit alpha [Tenericutes bacterium ADurb.Bin239]|nr:MAG: Evolved beta-galactosidase subunit alpha [Tenericutes bacterium ADurb.Bin239]